MIFEQCCLSQSGTSMLRLRVGSAHRNQPGTDRSGSARERASVAVEQSSPPGGPCDDMRVRESKNTCQYKPYLFYLFSVLPSDTLVGEKSRLG